MDVPLLVDDFLRRAKDLVDALPRTATGKMQKFRVRGPSREGRERRRA